MLSSVINFRHTLQNTKTYTFNILYSYFIFVTHSFTYDTSIFNVHTIIIINNISFYKYPSIKLINSFVLFQNISNFC